MTLLQGVREFFLRFSSQHTYWIAYSGGMDSHVLLSLCHELRNELALDIRAIHVNHHLHPLAHEWVQHCQAVCAAYAIPLLIRDVVVTREQGESLEEAARMKRYAVLGECLQPHDVLLTAHHQDDQAETVLLQLLRGAGLQGLAAMPEVKKLAQGFHARPLLHFTREQLRVAAGALQWIDDTSNENRDFDRNYLRHAIMPQLTQRWPAAVQTIARSAAHCAEAQTLLADLIAPLITEQTLSVQKILALPVAQQRLLLREWLRKHGHPAPNTKKMATILKTVLHAKIDRAPVVRWAGTELRRYGDDLYLLPALANHNTQDSYDWCITEPLVLPKIGTLRIEHGHADIDRTKTVWQVRFRRGGERLHMPGGSRSLKNMFQEWRVPPWLRDRIPLIFNKDELIAIAGYYLNEQFERETGYRIRLEAVR